MRPFYFQIKFNESDLFSIMFFHALISIICQFSFESVFFDKYLFDQLSQILIEITSRNDIFENELISKVENIWKQMKPGFVSKVLNQLMI